MVEQPNLQSLIEMLYRHFEQSLATGGAVAKGGPGGFPVDTGTETWNVGLSPDETFFASNRVSGRADGHCSYHFTAERMLVCSASSQNHPVELVEEVCWLIQLLKAADAADWNGRVNLPPRPKPHGA